MNKEKAFLSCLKVALMLAFFINFSASAYPVEYDSTVARRVVDSLKISKFKSYTKGLADIGGREYGTQTNTNGKQWLISALQGIGYTNVTTQSSTYNNVYCTKVGSVAPDSMYIISAHYDGMPVARAANDDASGCALVLEGARVFVNPLIKTHYSIRFILWNAEEKGLLGAKAYVTERRPLQGSSEPRWLGIIQHDMLLYDHGLPPQSQQSPNADIDVEFQKNSTAAAKSKALAVELQLGCNAYAPDYPADTGDNMSNTDSDPFKDYIAAVSVRENERIKEIGNYSDPAWHTVCDTFGYFSEKDFLLGFNCVQMTIGTICRLAGVYDSTPVSINMPHINKPAHYEISPIVRHIKVFNTQGVKVAEHIGRHNWRHYCKEIQNNGTMPSGLYIIQLIDCNNRAESRYLRIVE